MSEAISSSLQSIVSSMHLGVLAPHLIVSLGGIFLMLVAIGGKGAFRNNAILAVGILVATGVYILLNGASKTQVAFSGMVQVDFFANSASVLFCAIGVFIVFISHEYLKRRESHVAEYYSLLLFAISGMMFMTSANDLMIFYIGLEVLSISLYVMAGIDTSDLRSTEAGIKYFLTSVFASAFLLFGVAFVYGATGSTSFVEIRHFVATHHFSSSPFLYAGVIFILAGVAFKISAVPFHMWTPDVYQGAPISVTAFLSTGPKIASFAFLFRFFYLFQGSQPYPDFLADVIIALAVITMVVGNLLALNQDDIKRMLAFSSVTHMGYVLTAFASRSEAAVSAAMFYFMAYVFMNIGIFGVLLGISGGDDKKLNIENFKGLSSKKPGIALLLLFFLFSLAGIPPLIGFAAKFFVFSAVLDAKMYSLAIIGILNSAVSAYYYLRIVIYMYLKPADEGQVEFKEIRFAVLEKIGVGFCLLMVICIGLQPSFLVSWFSKITL